MLQQLVILMLATTFIFIACTKQKNEKKPIETVSEPIDTTDIFAIPLDNSEREENEDEKYLKKMEKKRLKLEKEAAKKKKEAAKKK